jgi:hypothetical protein
MKKNALFKAILPVFCFFMPISGHAQNLPLALGAVLEVSSEIERITPFASIWLNGLGFIRVGVNTGSQEEIDSLGDSNEAKRFDLSAQIGYNITGPERPYITASYTRNKIYLTNSDMTWNEWGVGFGHKFSIAPIAGIIIEAQHIWITKHYNQAQNIDVSGRRLQMNFGFMVYPY